MRRNNQRGASFVEAALVFLLVIVAVGIIHWGGRVWDHVLGRIYHQMVLQSGSDQQAP